MKVFRFCLKAVLIAFLLACVDDARAQDLSPKANLSSVLYRELRGDSKDVAPIDRMIDQLERISQRIDSIQQQQANQMERQRVMAEQMQGMAEVTKQVTANHERLNSLERRLERQENASGNDPRDIAVLETKMDAIAGLVTWLIGGVGSLVLGALTFLVKRHFARGGFRPVAVKA